MKLSASTVVLLILPACCPPDGGETKTDGGGGACVRAHACAAAPCGDQDELWRCEIGARPDGCAVSVYYGPLDCDRDGADDPGAYTCCAAGASADATIGTGVRFAP